MAGPSAPAARLRPGSARPFRINCDTIRELYGIELGPDGMEAYLAEQVRRAGFQTPPRSFRDAVVALVGGELYRVFYRDNMAKQWRRPPEELEPEVARRVPVRSNRDPRHFTAPYQGIPAQGYSAMFRALLDHPPRIRLLLGCDCFEAGADLEAALTVYTGEVDRFFDYRYGRLEYSSLRFVYETVDQAPFQPAAVVSYPGDHAWTRITEYRHLTGQRDARSTICYEYPEAEGDPYYPVLTRANLAVREKYLAEVAALEAGGHHLFLGRLARHAYRNMDQVVRAALDGVRKWLAEHRA